MNLKGYVSLHLPVPISVQNLVLRNYCEKNGHKLSLPDVEFVKDFKMLDALLGNLDAWDGVVAYSMWTMPLNPVDIPEGKEFHFALEDLRYPRDAERIDMLAAVRRAMG